MRNVKVLITVLTTFVMSAALFGQSISFRAEQLTVPPSDIPADNCVQVGIFMEVENGGAIADDATWESIGVKVNYALSGGLTLANDPVAEISDFLGTLNAGYPEIGIADPGNPISGSPCAGADVVNSATLGGLAANYLGNEGSSDGALGFPTENVNTITQQITLARVHTATIFETDGATEYLVGMISFQVDGPAGLGGVIDITFEPGAGQNFIQSSSFGALDADGNTTDGYVVVFETLDCTGATALDNIGGDSGANIGLDYIDPNAGGVGGDITLTMPHAVDPDEILISPNDGSGDITLTGGQIGTGSSTLDLDTTADGTPVTTGSVTYTISYGANNPLGGISFGEPCTVTVTWNAPVCTAVFDTTPVAGSDTNLDVTLENAYWDGTRYGYVTLPDASTVDLSVPSSTVGNVLTFDDAVAIVGIGVSDTGTYTVTVNGPASQTNTCSDDLFLECPTNNTTCPAATVQIEENPVTIPLSGSNVADWDIIYDGVTTNYPGDTVSVDIGPIVGDATSVTITANGFSPTGDPCDDEVVCPLDFEAPTCDVALDPPTPVDGYDVGTVVELQLTTTNGIDAVVDISGSPMAMTPDNVAVDNYNNVWRYSYTVGFPTTLVATVTGPDGDTTTCDFVIDVACNVTAIYTAPPGTVGGVTIEGIGSVSGLMYDVYYSSDPLVVGDTVPAGAIFAGQIPVYDNGIGVGPAGHAVQPDAYYAACCEGSDLMLAVTGIRTVPTLGQWGLGIFALLLVGAGLFFLRRGRMS